MVDAIFLCVPLIWTLRHIWGGDKLILCEKRKCRGEIKLVYKSTCSLSKNKAESEVSADRVISRVTPLNDSYLYSCKHGKQKWRNVYRK